MRISDWSSDVCSSDLLEATGVDLSGGLQALTAARKADAQRSRRHRIQFQAAEAVRQIESAPSCRPAPFALGNARQMRRQVQATTEPPNHALFVAPHRQCIATAPARQDERPWGQN